MEAETLIGVCVTLVAGSGHAHAARMGRTHLPNVRRRAPDTEAPAEAPLSVPGLGWLEGRVRPI